MTKMMTVVALAGLAVACAKNQAPPAAPSSASTDAGAPGSDDASIPNKDPNKARLVVSDRIREACGIDDTETYFDYNSDAISAGTQTVLVKLADCFMRGPLAGESMRLVGHADPRGSDEYNMVLGSRRAESVKTVLGRLGLSQDRVTTSSRGEMDATGTDEDSWAADRKVEVMLDG